MMMGQLKSSLHTLLVAVYLLIYISKLFLERYLILCESPMPILVL